MSSGIQKFIAITGGLTLLVLVVILLMPKERADQISNSLQRLSGDSGIICLDYHRKSLKDPDSASLIGASKSGSEYLPEVQITYKAKNSYGAFITLEAGCSLNEKGQVNAQLTELKRTTKETMQGFDDQIVCFKQQIEDQKQGNPLAAANFQACKMKASLSR